jgi:hypothetical protein
LGLIGTKEEAKESFIMRSFMICLISKFVRVIDRVWVEQRGHVARTVKRRNAQSFWWRNMKERYHLG